MPGLRSDWKMASGENWTVSLALFSSFGTLVIVTCKVIRQNCVLTMLCCPQEAKKNPQGGTGSKSSHRKIRGNSSETGEAVDKFVLTPPQLQRLPIKGATCGSTPALFSSNEPQWSWVCVGENAWGCWAFSSTLIRTSFLPDRVKHLIIYQGGHAYASLRAGSVRPLIWAS